MFAAYLTWPDLITFKYYQKVCTYSQCDNNLYDYGTILEIKVSNFLVLFIRRNISHIALVN